MRLFSTSHTDIINTYLDHFSFSLPGNTELNDFDTLCAQADNWIISENLE